VFKLDRHRLQHRIKQPTAEPATATATATKSAALIEIAGVLSDVDWWRKLQLPLRFTDTTTTRERTGWYLVCKRRQGAPQGTGCGMSGVQWKASRDTSIPPGIAARRTRGCHCLNAKRHANKNSHQENLVWIRIRRRTSEPDYLQNLTGTFLSKDTSAIKFSWKSDHSLRRYKSNCGKMPSQC